MDLWCWLVILCGLITAIGGVLTFIYSYHNDMTKRKFLILTIAFAFILLCVLIPKPLQQLMENKDNPSKITHSETDAQVNGTENTGQNMANDATDNPNFSIEETADKTVGNNIPCPEQNVKYGAEKAANNANNEKIIKDETASNENKPRPTVNQGRTTENVHFRSSPGINARIIKIFPAGTTVEIYGTHDPDNWVKVRDMGTGQEGWVFGKFITPI